MTSKRQNAETRPLDDHEIAQVCGGFFLMQLLVPIKEIAIIMGMQVPPVTKVR